MGARVATRSRLDTLRRLLIGPSGGGVAGRVPFYSDLFALDSDANLVWNNTNKWLGVGRTPADNLDVGGHIDFGGALGTAKGRLVEPAANDIQIRLNASATDVPDDTGKPAWAVRLDLVADTFELYRAPATSGTLAFAVKFLVSSVGEVRFIGGRRHPVRTITANRTLDDTDDVVVADTSGGNITVTLPSASGASGRVYTIVKSSGSNTLTVQRSGTDTLNFAGTTSFSATAIDSKFMFQSNGGSVWIRVI